MSYKTPLLIEQHIHGAFGVDFNKTGTDGVLMCAKKLYERKIGGFFPTLVTDSVENIKRQIRVIKEAARLADKESARILGIHLEGIFINPAKKGIHNPAHFLPLTKENYRLIQDEFIRIVTLAPELDEGLIAYLKESGVKVQAGHCIGADLSNIDGVTHLFNAMAGINHREGSTALSALVNDNIYTEIIADGVHLSDDILRLVLRSKPADKVILVSDALPITDSGENRAVFADSEIFYDGERAVSADGTIAGSTTLLDKVVKRLIAKGLFNPTFVENVYKYHDMDVFGEVEW